MEATSGDYDNLLVVSMQYANVVTEGVMWNEPVKEKLDKISRLYETKDMPLLDKLIYLHFFIFGSDWYISEYDGDDTFLGFVILNNDYINAEWVYIVSGITGLEY